MSFFVRNWNMRTKFSDMTNIGRRCSSVPCVPVSIFFEEKENFPSPTIEQAYVGVPYAAWKKSTTKIMLKTKKKTTPLLDAFACYRMCLLVRTFPLIIWSSMYLQISSQIATNWLNFILEKLLAMRSQSANRSCSVYTMSLYVFACLANFFCSNSLKP